MEDVALGANTPTLCIGTYNCRLCSPPRNQRDSGRRGICFAEHPYIYFLFGNKTVGTPTSGALPLAPRLSLKMPGTPRPRRQAPHVQPAHQLRWHALAPLRRKPQARVPDQEARVQRALLERRRPSQRPHGHPWPVSTGVSGSDLK
jgi:hypothetical protein